jgi:outer membrane protein assembly factor BamA
VTFLVAAALTACVGAQSQLPGQAATVTEIRVHGNATIADADVIRLAGVTVGAPLEADATAAIERRLRDSGRFDEVAVRKRYRSLAMDQVALVLIVHERPGISVTGEPPSLLRRLRSRLMFFPILSFEDGYGFTYGVRTSTVSALGLGERLSVPLSWGGTRRVALEADRTFHGGPITRVFGSVGLSQRENPFFNAADRRAEVSGRVERRLFRDLVLGAGITRTNVTFAMADDSFWTGGADVTLDTRGDPAYPIDAVVLGAGWNTLRANARDPIGRLRLDSRGYKRVFGQTVVAVRAQYDRADGPLPAYEEWLLGGGSTLRGYRAGSFAGDRRLVGSAEVRIPFSSALSVGRVGFTVFYDAGVVAPFGTALRDAAVHRGAGGGVFLLAPLINLNLSVAHALDGRGTRVHFGTGFSF